jgi:3-carboxy-cis,cis-muconate cycloisomerase
LTPGLLIDPLGTTDPLTEVFSDRSILQAMLDVEVALARGAAAAGAMPPEAAGAIAAAARAEDFDITAIARAARTSATPVIPLVAALTERVRTAAPRWARFVHYGVTSQDISDSALLVVLRRALALVAADHGRLAGRLRALSDAHAGAVMLGRTLLQPATPITFGLKTAGWYAAASRAWRRVAYARDDALVLQLGGASGTRAAFGPHAAAIASATARELGLAPAPPWHTDRDRLGALMAACGLYTAALGKVARDVTLLMQAEVAELTGAGGGSSTMPHKRNPAGAVVTLAAATRVPGLVAAFLTGMVQEHERAAGGSQAEWPTVAAIVQATGAAGAAMADTLDALVVDAARMRANLDATRGAVLAERAVMWLLPTLGRDAAQTLVAAALERSRQSGRTFAVCLGELPEAAAVLTAEELRDLDRPEAYLGEAERLRKELLRAPRSAEL